MLKKLISIGLLVVLASLSWLFIPAWVVPLRRGWLLLCILAVLLSFVPGRMISKQVMASFGIFSIILLLNAYLGDQYIGSIPNAVYELLVILLTPAVAIKIIKNNGIVLAKSIVIFVFLSLCIGAIASYFVLQYDPGIIRNLYQMTTNQGDVEIMYTYYKLGLFDYSTAHALPIIIPPLVYLTRNSNYRYLKVVYAFFIALCFFLTWMSEATTPLLLEAIILVFCLLYGENNSGKAFFKLFLFALIALVLSIPSVSSGIMKSFGELLGEESPITSRINEINSVAQNKNTSDTADIDNRMAHYGETFKLIESNLLLGSQKSPGNHSTFLDHFAAYGLVGLIPFVLYLFGQVIVISKLFPRKMRVVMMESTICAFLILALKGMSVWSIFFYLYSLVPLLLYVGDREDFDRFRNCICGLNK